VKEDVYRYFSVLRDDGNHDLENQLRQRENDWTENNWIVNGESQKLFELFFVGT